VESSFFENRVLFPAGSLELDCALLMRGIAHEWHGRGRLCAGCEQRQVTAASGTSRLCPAPAGSGPAEW
jgi:hypothetical protein